MDFKQMYQEKLVSAEKAASVIKSGDWVDYGFCVTHPVALDRALAARKDSLQDIKCRGGVELWVPEVMKIPAAESPFSWHSIHMSGAVRNLIPNGNAFYLPIRFPAMSVCNVLNVHICLTLVSIRVQISFFTPCSKTFNYYSEISQNNLVKFSYPIFWVMKEKFWY